jgi:predicted transcriptional regulator
MTTLTSTLAFRVPNAIKEQIEQLATASHRKKSDILLGWINEKLELESWQISETHKAIALADSGEFSTVADVEGFYQKWSI